MIRLKDPFGGIILNVAFRALVPFTIVYGIYVLCLGEFSPGAVSRPGRCFRWGSSFPVSFWAVTPNSTWRGGLPSSWPGWGLFCMPLPAG